MKGSTPITLLLAIAAIHAQGCATIINGTTEQISIQSNVSGANVYLNDTLLGVTPLIATVERGQQGTLRVEAANHEVFMAPVIRKVSGAFFVNIFSGGTFGSSTDAATGAMYEYEPSTFYADLKPLAAAGQDVERWGTAMEIRRFVLVHHEALVGQISAGDGPMLAALFERLDIQAPQEQRRALHRWRVAFRKSVHLVDFADTVVAELL